MEESTLEMVKAAAAVAVSGRARNTVILDLRELAAFTDFFVICSGISDTQIEGISEGILEELEDQWNARPWHREGERKADWILLDYVDFVVHVFLHEKRDYYNLEHLWAEAPTIEVPDVEATEDEYGEAYDALADEVLDDDDDFDGLIADDFDNEVYSDSDEQEILDADPTGRS